MITVIITPLIYIYIRKVKITGIILLGLLWYFGKLMGFNDHTAYTYTIFFFTSGAYFGINKRNLIIDMGRIKLFSFVSYPLIVIVDLLTKQYTYNIFIHNAGILIGMVFWFNIAFILLKSKKVKANKFLSASSFFIFAIHAPLLLILVRKLTFTFFKPLTDMALTIMYFINGIMIILIALVLYYVLRRYFPKFTNIITGGR
jgi:hypothetical protein